jgi:hypothetical protein
MFVALQENCMVCGIDSYHDAGKRGGSVAGFVSSLNQTLTRWYSKVCFQGPGQELVDGLKACLISALKYYYDVCLLHIKKFNKFICSVLVFYIFFYFSGALLQFLDCFLACNSLFVIRNL